MKVKIRLDTVKDINKFVEIATSIKGKLTVTNGDGLTVNAKSMLGVMYSWSEWDNMYLESDDDHFFVFRPFIIEE